MPMTDEMKRRWIKNVDPTPPSPAYFADPLDFLACVCQGLAITSESDLVLGDLAERIAETNEMPGSIERLEEIWTLLDQCETEFARLGVRAAWQTAYVMVLREMAGALPDLRDELHDEYMTALECEPYPDWVMMAAMARALHDFPTNRDKNPDLWNEAEKTWFVTIDQIKKGKKADLDPHLFLVWLTSICRGMMWGLQEDGVPRMAQSPHW